MKKSQMKIFKLTLILAIIVSILPIAVVQAGSMYTSINNQTLSEGGSSLGYQLRLSATPSTGNNVSVTWTTNSQCHVSSEGRGFARTGQVITTNDKFEFAVKAVDDNTQESTNSCSITYRTTSDDPNLHNLSTAQTFTILDNNDAAATTPALYTTIIGPSSITEGNGSLYSFGVGPSTAAVDKLTISASTNDGQCELVNGGQVANYLEQTIAAGVQGSAIFTVRAINDSDVEGDHTCTVIHSLRTDDTTYTGITVANTSVPITDDEAAYSSDVVDSEELFKRAEFGKLDAKDANNDGVEDEAQRNLGVFINAVSGRRQAIEVKGQSANCNAVSTPTSQAEDQLKKQNDDFHFPHGVIGFKVICDTPGASAEIKMYLDDLYNTADIELQKYSEKAGYSKIEDIEISEFETQNGSVSLITYKLTDGGELDEDGKVDGIITDPVGIAISAVEPPSQMPVQINNASTSSKNMNLLILLIPATFLAAVGGVIIHKRYLRKPREMR